MRHRRCGKRRRGRRRGRRRLVGQRDEGLQGAACAQDIPEGGLSREGGGRGRGRGHEGGLEAGCWRAGGLALEG